MLNTPNPALNCPDAGVWRAWLDHEDQRPQLESHLAECPGCRAAVADLRADAALVGQALAALAPDQSDAPATADVAIARDRLAQRQRWPAAPARVAPQVREPIPMFLSRIPTPWRIATSGVAAALVLSLLVALTPGGRAIASGFLAQFRSEEVTAIEVTPQTQAEILKTMNALGNLGTVKTPAGVGSQPEAAARAAVAQAHTSTLAEATAAVGVLETPDPATLPAGMDKTPRVQIVPASQVRFTIDKAKASAYLKANGHADVTVPDKFDGAALVVSLPAGALLQYGSTSTRDALIIGQAGQLVVDTEGKVSLDEMRNFLLGLGVLPPAVAKQLGAMNNWSQTLPIPIPVDQVHWQAAKFQKGQYPGLLLNDNSGVGSAAIWYHGGHMYGLAGSLKATELKNIADNLRVGQ